MAPVSLRNDSMCGFAGVWRSDVPSAEELRDLVDRMSSTLVHRGPDDAGLWTEPAAGLALGFRRLSILDLSELGHQPMRSSSGRFTIVFNGEAYNFQELRAELISAGHRFRGGSDTEVILAGFDNWGIAPTIKRLLGMFAMAVWDSQERTLTLARDRMGIKPLFVSAQGGTIRFGSELKAIAADPSFDRRIDPSSVASFLQFLYVPGPAAIYQDTIKLPPGHILTIREPAHPLPRSTSYWSLEEVAEQGLSNPFTGDDTEALDELEEHLRAAVRPRMIADVPIGAFLSGGIDSSLVVALMQEASSDAVRTFSIAFEEAEYNESEHAERVAAHLGTRHETIEVTGTDALAMVPLLPDIFDEPHADAAQIPSYLLFQAGRSQAAVALSGDGGDEIFAGYNRYFHTGPLYNRLARIPRPARRAGSAMIGAISPDAWTGLLKALRPITPSRYHMPVAGLKFSKLRTVLESNSAEEAYTRLASAWQDPYRAVPGAERTASRLGRMVKAGWPPTLIERMLLADQATYLPEDQLAKVDRVSMAHSLEVRVPLIDHRLVEFSWRLPQSMKVRDGSGKWLLRNVLHRHVPREIVERPKQGFSVPIAEWLRGPLREWAEELLTPAALSRDGLLDPVPIRKEWDRLVGGRSENELAMWSMVMYQAWRERWIG